MKKRIVVFLLSLCMIVMLFPMTALADSPAAVDIDSLPAPVVDPTLANSLNPSYFGYLEKTFDVDGTARTAKIYISEDQPIRSYFTVIAVPNGVTDVYDFITRTGWKDVADSKQEGLYILEPAGGTWGTYDAEQAYVSAAINYYAGSGNSKFSIFGEHYFVGYGAGAPVLEAWAVANPVKVISQVYLNSTGVPQSYIDSYASTEYDGKNGTYIEFTFPEGFDKITYAETVLPTWYINPDASAADSIAYWKASNDCEATGVADAALGTVYNQADPSDRWQTSYMGSISKVAVRGIPTSYYDEYSQADIQDFLYYYSRYENNNGYCNQLVIRADYDELGIELHTMYVNGRNREYMTYVPDSAAANWGDAAPVMMVWPGNSQTDRVFLDATAWWKVAQDEGFILVIICERINSNAISVSHGDNDLFYAQLKEELINNYDVDPTRFYATGQSAGSMTVQGFSVNHPEYYAAIASTSGTSSPGATAAYEMIPVFQIDGAGDMTGMAGDLWDTRVNGLDTWAAYHLGVDGLELGDGSNSEVSGWYDRFTIWTWTKNFGGVEVPLFKTGLNAYRNHNCIHEEMPMLWDFARHYSMEFDYQGNVVRYYSPSGFTVPGDKVCLTANQGSEVGAVVDPSFIVTIPTSVNFGTLIKNTGIQEKPFVVTMSDSVLGAGAHVDVNVFSTFLMSAGSATLGYDLFNEAGVQQSNGSTYTSFTADGSDTGKVTVDTAEIIQAGAYNGTMLFNFTYVG